MIAILLYKSQTESGENLSSVHNAMNITENERENLLADVISTITSTLERSLGNEVVQNDHNNYSQSLAVVY